MSAIILIVFLFGTASAQAQENVPGSAPAACFEPAIEAGLAAKDASGQFILVSQVTAPNTRGQIGDTVIGIAVKGKYYGCRALQSQIAKRRGPVGKFSLFLPLHAKTLRAPVKGFELDIAMESRRILSARSIQVPWDIVDRSQGVETVCHLSQATTFEGFLYKALRSAGTRRCTQNEIENFVGRSGSLKSDVR